MFAFLNDRVLLPFSMLFLRILPVFAILFVGFGAGAVSLFSSTRTAIQVLNRYSLYIAAPLLIFAGMVDPSLSLPLRPGFYLAHVLALMVGLLFVLLCMPVRTLRPHAGTLALAIAYGNITFLGIPVLHRAFGEEALGLAALSSGIHTILAMTVGPALFLLWNQRSADDSWSLKEVGRRLVRQPMVWSPLLGLLARLFGENVQKVLFDYSMVIAVSAGPTAIFMLGLYFWERRETLRHIRMPAVVTVALKLLVLPAVTLGVLVAMRPFFELTPLENVIVLCQSAMPTAITTYSLAEEFDNDRETVATAAILSAVVSLVTLPVVMSAAERWFLV